MVSLRGFALLLTVLTGFTGLVYEVTWQKYLATLLGSHSEATAAVLGIFLAGLSTGYSLFGALTKRIVARAQQRNLPPRLLLTYGMVEAGIGIYALLFPVFFGWVRTLSLSVPHGAGGMGFAFDVGLTALLIGPPTVMMGGTIPILTQALARSLADATRFHAFVYAFNTAGAFVGAIAAGFFLVPWLGLARAMFAMGAVNIAAGSLFALLGSRPRSVISLTDTSQTAPRIEGFASYVAVSLLSGFAMMALQNILIRLGGLSFGSSEFTFATVVAVFVLCIALGSFAVSALPRIRPSYLVANQVLLVLLLYFLYPLLEQAPYWVHVLRTGFPDTDAGFYPFYLSGFLCILLAIGPPVMLSGATLPLLFHQMRRQAADFGSLAGQIYSWNTVGSLLGAILGGYALLFWVDLHHVYRIALAALALSAAILVVRVYRVSRLAVGAVVLAPTLLALLLLEAWQPHMLSAGLFRAPARRGDDILADLPREEAFDRLSKAPRIVFYDDDPTMSVAVRDNRTPEGLVRSIINNGKSDGSTRGDYTTMMLCAILPALLADELERAFVIGYGTGISAGEFASLESVKEVVVAEISAGVVRASSLFDFANHGASRHPKVKVVRSDAYRALLRSEGSFDAIASEPSNPWSAGVEMLYSREFLEAARSRLSPAGVYVQWYHQYETDSESLELVLRTYASVFDAVSVWYSQRGDLMLVGFKDSKSALDVARMARRASRPDIAGALRRGGIDSFPELLAHELLPLGVVHAAKLEGSIHTLYHPILSHAAGRAFYRAGRGHLPFTGAPEPARVGAENSLLRRYRALQGGVLPEAARADLVGEACHYRPKQCGALLAEWLAEDPESEALEKIIERMDRRAHEAGHLDRELISEISAFTSGGVEALRGPVSPEEAERFTTLYRSYYQHAAPFDASALREMWSRCEPPGDAPAACREGRERARHEVPGLHLGSSE